MYKGDKENGVRYAGTKSEDFDESGTLKGASGPFGLLFNGFMKLSYALLWIISRILILVPSFMIIPLAMIMKLGMRLGGIKSSFSNIKKYAEKDPDVDITK